MTNSLLKGTIIIRRVPLIKWWGWVIKWHESVSIIY